jgi:hypothetical protein
MPLEPCSPIDARCDLKIDDIWEAFHDGESLAACLEVGIVLLLWPMMT